MNTNTTEILAGERTQELDPQEKAILNVMFPPSKNLPDEYQPNPTIQKWLDDASQKLRLAGTMLTVLKHIEANPSLPTDPFYMRQIRAVISKVEGR